MPHTGHPIEPKPRLPGQGQVVRNAGRTDAEAFANDVLVREHPELWVVYPDMLVQELREQGPGTHYDYRT